VAERSLTSGRPGRIEPEQGALVEIVDGDLPFCIDEHLAGELELAWASTMPPAHPPESTSVIELHESVVRAIEYRDVGLEIDGNEGAIELEERLGAAIGPTESESLGESPGEWALLTSVLDNGDAS
jgi:hypothetical protein